MTTKYLFRALVCVTTLCVAGCEGETSFRQASPAKTTAEIASEPVIAPSIRNLPEEGKLVKELIDIDTHVFSFSGTLLLIWLEMETKLEGEESTTRHGPVSSVNRRSIRGDSIASVTGKVVISGELMENPKLRLQYKSQSHGGGSRSQSTTPLAPPWPKNGGFGGNGYQWHCPDDLPEIGEKFLIASINKIVWAPAPTAEEKFAIRTLREDTLRIFGRRLPGAPEPTELERNAVTALRAANASVFTTDYGRDHASYEGEPNTPAKKVAFHSNGNREGAFDKSRANLHLLEQLPELESLSFRSAKITDDDLAQLGDLTHLMKLDLNRTKVTGNGMIHLESLTMLRELWLANTEVDDASLEHIGKLNNLEVLSLADTQITDMGLKHLFGLKKLKQLRLPSGTVSEDAIEKLSEALPNCEIHD